ncbi:deoxyUTP pyrophosphatase [Bacillus phage JL]|uniref:dUTP diphosphatase n=1 Tax=Bacillus phage JL TaxID=1296655 RepID=S5M8H3_9CAUD|nr:deoxyUTP pyrophosphatase [Bacillus phage JL]AGR46808.1 deoxyUTP pyrophosphatase [Bacillus phage JL]
MDRLTNLEKTVLDLESALRQTQQEFTSFKDMMLGQPELPYFSDIPGYQLKYHHDGDAGIDLPIFDERLLDGEFSTEGFVDIHPGCSYTLKTGIHMAIPQSHYGMLDTRSGTSKLKMTLLCRTIDEPFRGNIRLALHNVGTETVRVANYDELAQMVIKRYTKAVPKGFATYGEFLEYAGNTARGQEGFGSKERNLGGGN